MNTAIIWVFIPILAGILIWLLRDQTLLAKAASLVICSVLFILSLILPVDSVITAGPIAFQISSEMNILGRSLIITNADLPLITLMFGFALFWFIGMFFQRISQHFPAISMLILGLMIAAVSVEPFLYAALIIELIVLVTIPLFIRDGIPVGKGLVRFIQFQTLAMPFVLYAGWTILGVEANRANVQMIQQTIIALGLGFALWLAIFPFYSWIPLLTAEADPYIAGYFLLLYPITTIHLGMKFLNTYSWLRESSMLLDVIQGAGILLVLSSGILSIYQKDTRKLFGYLVLMENGFSLLAISMNTQMGYQIYFAAMFPRLITYALWTFAATKLFSINGVNDNNEKRKGFYILILLVTMIFSVGLPLFATAPYRIQVIDHLLAQPIQIKLLMIGMLGYGIGVFRSVFNLVNGEIEAFREMKLGYLFRIESFILYLGLLGLILIGVFPQIFENASLLLIQIYDKLIA